MKTESEIKAARELHKLLAEACKTANAKDASATLCNEDGGPVDSLPDSELAKASELYVALDFIPWREGVRPLTESGRREMVVEQNTLDAIQRLAEKHGTLGEQYHIDSIDGPGYGWSVTALPLVYSLELLAEYHGPNGQSDWREKWVDEALPTAPSEEELKKMLSDLAADPGDSRAMALKLTLWQGNEDYPLQSILWTDSQECVRRYYAVIAEDREGPAYGVGESEAEAREDARRSGFGDSGIVIAITELSYQMIREGEPQAVIEDDMTAKQSKRADDMIAGGGTW